MGRDELVFGIAWTTLAGVAIAVTVTAWLRLRAVGDRDALRALRRSALAALPSVAVILELNARCLVPAGFSGRPSMGFLLALYPWIPAGVVLLVSSCLVVPSGWRTRGFEGVRLTHALLWAAGSYLALYLLRT